MATQQLKRRFLIAVFVLTLGGLGLHSLPTLNDTPAVYASESTVTPTPAGRGDDCGGVSCGG